MDSLLTLWRLPRTAFILGRAGVLGHLAKIDLLPDWFCRLLLVLNFIIAGRKSRKDAGQALCDALQALGPGFVKFGQALATRADLIGPELASGLVQLQDRMPPFSGKRAIQIIEDTTQKPLSELFLNFQETAIAAASIAQVHKATLPDGRVVAVKILRPGIAKRLRRDVRFFRTLAQLAEALAPGLRRLKLVTAVQQFEQISDIELDLRMEAAAGSRLRENMAGDKGIRIPFIDLERTNSHMLVIEWIDGVRIDDVDGLQAAGHDIAKITEAAATSFFNQVFRDGYFHADMHPGNIFVTSDGLLVPIDFGIMGQLDFVDRLFLARLLDAILNRDYDKVARLHYDAGMLDDTVSLAAFSQSLRSVADPVLGKSLGDISLGLVLGQILQISARFDISVQPQFNLLQKTMMMAEGVARSLNPNADMWSFARPLASDWISSEDNIRAQIDRVFSDLRQIYLKLPQILEKLDKPVSPPPTPKWPYVVTAISVLIALYSTLYVH